MTNKQAAEELVSLYALCSQRGTVNPDKRTAIVMAIAALTKNEDVQPDINKLI